MKNIIKINNSIYVLFNLKLRQKALYYVQTGDIGIKIERENKEIGFNVLNTQGFSKTNLFSFFFCNRTGLCRGTQKEGVDETEGGGQILKKINCFCEKP